MSRAASNKTSLTGQVLCAHYLSVWKPLKVFNKDRLWHSLCAYVIARTFAVTMNKKPAYLEGFIKTNLPVSWRQHIKCIIHEMYPRYDSKFFHLAWKYLATQAGGGQMRQAAAFLFYSVFHGHGGAMHPRIKLPRWFKMQVQCRCISVDGDWRHFIQLLSGLCRENPTETFLLLNMIAYSTGRHAPFLLL